MTEPPYTGYTGTVFVLTPPPPSNGLSQTTFQTEAILPTFPSSFSLLPSSSFLLNGSDTPHLLRKADPRVIITPDARIVTPPPSALLVDLVGPPADGLRLLPLPRVTIADFECIVFKVSLFTIIVRVHVHRGLHSYVVEQIAVLYVPERDEERGEGGAGGENKTHTRDKLAW